MYLYIYIYIYTYICVCYVQDLMQTRDMWLTTVMHGDFLDSCGPRVVDVRGSLYYAFYLILSLTLISLLQHSSRNVFYNQLPTCTPFLVPASRCFLACLNHDTISRASLPNSSPFSTIPGFLPHSVISESHRAMYYIDVCISEYIYIYPCHPWAITPLLTSALVCMSCTSRCRTVPLADS